ncbi:hypothetical protein M3J09_007227 [Ascochyta lentis]
MFKDACRRSYTRAQHVPGAQSPGRSLRLLSPHSFKVGMHPGCLIGVQKQAKLCRGMIAPASCLLATYQRLRIGRTRRREQYRGDCESSRTWIATARVGLHIANAVANTQHHRLASPPRPSTDSS